MSRHNRIAEDLSALERVAAAIKLEHDTMRVTQHEAEHLAVKLAKATSAHEKLAASIESRMDHDRARIQQLEIDQQRLRSLLSSLDREQASDKEIAFSTLVGKLPWPAAGAVGNTPGKAIRRGGARWPGLLIKAPSGTQVRAVAAGEVVFSDWFRNLGQLVIIDHGEGYLSLYGNNAELTKSAGDIVAAGDVVATVGGGGRELPIGVYFELRNEGNPLDPRKWLSKVTTANP